MNKRYYLYTNNRITHARLRTPTCSFTILNP